MVGNRRETTLGEVAQFDSGHRNSQDAVEAGEYPFFTCSREILRHSEFDFDTEAVIMAGNNAEARFHLQYYKGKFAARQRTYIIRPAAPDVDCRYLYFAMHRLQPLFAAQAQGTTTKFVTIGILRSAPISLPPISEQRAIAHILGSLDDKIELNRRMNGTLEAIARAIFKSWFVDFAPVRAKASGEPPESICRRLGLTPDLLALFPGRLVGSELGEIPEGWEIDSLDAFATLNTTSTSPGKQPNAEFEHYSIPAFDSAKRPAYESGSIIKSNKYVVSPKAVLVSKLNPETPRIWLPSVKTERAICSTEFMQFVPLFDYGRTYLYLMMSSELLQMEILKRVTGSTGSRQRAQPSQIAVLPVLLPPVPVIRVFESIAEPLLQNVTAHLDQMQTLATLRDTLLPRLLSGELSVNRFENPVNAEVV